MDSVKLLIFCSCSLIFVVLTDAAPAVGPARDGSGELFNDCLQQKTKLQNCNDSQLVTQFYFDQRQNRCRGYHTCPIIYRAEVPNLFRSREECTTACPATTCAVPAKPHVPNSSQILVEHDNGIVNLRYSCSEGYRLKGNGELTCRHNGTWSGEKPECTIQCPALRDIPNGKTQLHPPGSYRDPNTVAIYSCEKSFKNILNHNMYRICLDNGTWTDQEPFCGRIEIRHNNMEVLGSITATEDEVLEVDCLMTPSFPPNVNVTWFPKPDGNRSDFWSSDKSAYSLEIPHLSMKDSGGYTCIVNISNGGYNDIKKIEVKVVRPGDTVKVVAALSEFQNSDLWMYMNCMFHGSIKPEVTWKYNDVLLSEGDRQGRIDIWSRSFTSQSHSFSWLVIQNPRPEDSGKYSCEGRVNNVTAISAKSVTVLPRGQIAKRSSISQSPLLAIETLCGTADPATATAIHSGKMVRQLRDGAYYLLLDRVIHTSSSNKQLASGKLIRTRYLQHTVFPLTRQTKYIFVVRTTDRGDHILTTAYPYSQDLETMLSYVCPQLNH